MIPVELAPEPNHFDLTVRQPGLRAIAELVGERPERPHGRRFKKIADHREEIPPSAFPSYWREVTVDLLQAYHSICAYSCFRIHRVTGAQTVDHFAPKSQAWDQVYEWQNYRLACSRLNARKNNYEDVLDPCEILRGWFQLELVGFQVLAATNLSPELTQQVQETIARLGLNDFCRDREEYAMDYWMGEVSFAVLQREAPFVAEEIRRQNRLTR